jgi:hypothetical protein
MRLAKRFRIDDDLEVVRQMEIGQIIHNNPVLIPAPDFVEALLSHIRHEIARVYWNVNQKPWSGCDDFGESDERNYDTGIPGVEWHPYYNWGGSPDDDDWDQSEADKPNFSFEGVEIRWYKHIGRSLNTNCQWHPEKWARWFERCMQTISAYEHAHSSVGVSSPAYTPDPDGAIALTEDSREFYHAELLEKVNRLEAQLNCIACVALDVEEGKPPRFDKSDWRWCEELGWITRLGNHALLAPGKFTVDGDEKPPQKPPQGDF